MKIWLSKNSEISVREQLVAQVTLGVVSGDLPAGERLPSTRELSRRFQIHANTIAAAYRTLSENRLIEFKRGSGFYVCDAQNDAKDDDDGAPTLDALVDEFFRAALSRGFSRTEIENRLQRIFAEKTLKEVLVVDSDAALRLILIEEIRAATNLSVSGASCEEFQKNDGKTNAVVAAMFDEKAEIEAILPAGKRRLFLTARSVANSLHGETRPESEDLIAVASGWANFLSLSKTVLVAANVEADSIVLRSTSERNWRKGLENASLIICDALTAKHFARDDRRVRPFRLISDDSLDKLKLLADF